MLTDHAAPTTWQVATRCRPTIRTASMRPPRLPASRRRRNRSAGVGRYFVQAARTMAMERRYPAGRRACGRCEMMMTYRAVVKDNQWWYAGHSDGQRLDTEDAVTLIIDGRPCPMRHAAIGRASPQERS